jgi:hypothetical protein
VEVERLNKKSIIFILLTLILIFSATACSNNSADSSKNDQESNQNQQSDNEPSDSQKNGEAGSEKGETSEKERIIKAKGVYTGQVDSNSIEIQVDGEVKILRLTEESKELAANLKENEEATFAYVETESGQFILVGVNEQMTSIPEPSEETVDALPGSKEIVVFVEGVEDVRQGMLERADGYYLYILPNFVFKDNVISFVHDEKYQARIELLGNTADLDALRKDAEKELSQIGTVEESKVENNPNNPPAKFLLYANNEHLSKSIMVVQVGQTYFKYTLDIPNGEASEGVYPSLKAMLKTVDILTK